MALHSAHGAGDKPYALVLGATSLVGPHLLRRLAERGFAGSCLSRRPPPVSSETPPGFSWRPVPESPVAQSSGGRGQDFPIPAEAVVFSLVPISVLPSLLPSLLPPSLAPSLARGARGRRLIALSTSSVVFKARSPDPAERRLADEIRRAEGEVRRLCRENGMAWTIFRPTLVYDPGRDRNVSAIAAFVRRFGTFPVVWPGRGRRQPIHADDVAQAMVAALDVSMGDIPAGDVSMGNISAGDVSVGDASGGRDAPGALFDLPGGETLPYREMVGRIVQSLERRAVVLYVPAGPARMAFQVWRRMTKAPYSAASLERMNIDLTLDPAPVQKALGITCRPFRPRFPQMRG